MGNSISYGKSEVTLDLGTRGALRGLQYDQKVRRYAGIPYALPPTGDHRWRKARPLPAGYSYSSPDGGAYDATAFRSVCPQPGFGLRAEQAEGGTTEDEDCLFLNIWTPIPAAGPGKKWPVFVWLHGGWFQMGDPSHERTMDPVELISTGELQAIVIAVGYRLNLFGFLASRELHEESQGDSVGNYGLWDQRLALEWIQENIALLGGDPTNVTLAGRSAGAYGVHAQTLYDFRTQPETQGNHAFHRIFMCSNAIPAQPKTPSETQEQFDEVCHYFNIPQSLSGPEKLARLRAVQAPDLIAAIKHLKNHTFRPVTDNLFIHPGLIEYHKSGDFATKFRQRGFKLLIGEVLNEETLYANYNSPEPNLESLKEQVGNYYAKDVTERALQWYEMPKREDPAEWKTLFGNIIADGQVRAPSRMVAQSLFAHGVDIKDVWRYRISYRLSFIDEKVAPIEMGVAHATDKPIWSFSTYFGPTETEAVFMKAWIDDLVAFVQNKSHDYGTKQPDDFKLATPKAQIVVEKDERWQKLLELADVFSGSS